VQNFVQISSELAVRGSKTSFGVKTENGLLGRQSATPTTAGKVFQYKS